jgi:hypothetical protein
MLGAPALASPLQLHPEALDGIEGYAVVIRSIPARDGGAGAAKKAIWEATLRAEGIRVVSLGSIDDPRHARFTIVYGREEYTRYPLLSVELTIDRMTPAGRVLAWRSYHETRIDGLDPNDNRFIELSREIIPRVREALRGTRRFREEAPRPASETPSICRNAR